MPCNSRSLLRHAKWFFVVYFTRAVVEPGLLGWKSSFLPLYHPDSLINKTGVAKAHWHDIWMGIWGLGFKPQHIWQPLTPCCQKIHKKLIPNQDSKHLSRLILQDAKKPHFTIHNFAKNKQVSTMKRHFFYSSRRWFSSFAIRCPGYPWKSAWTAVWSTKWWECLTLNHSKTTKRQKVPTMETPKMAKMTNHTLQCAKMGHFARECFPFFQFYTYWI